MPVQQTLQHLLCTRCCGKKHKVCLFNQTNPKAYLVPSEWVVTHIYSMFIYNGHVWAILERYIYWSYACHYTLWLTYIKLKDQNITMARLNWLSISFRVHANQMMIKLHGSGYPLKPQTTRVMIYSACIINAYSLLVLLSGHTYAHSGLFLLSINGLLLVSFMVKWIHRILAIHIFHFLLW